MKTITIDGTKIHDIPTFYEEINRVFMQDEDWKLGESLDGFNDLLYGGFGLIKDSEKIKLVWKNFEENRESLGIVATRNFYLKKLEHPEIFNVEYIKKSLENLENGNGQTYFEIILEIISEHPNIVLEPEN